MLNGGDGNDMARYAGTKSQYQVTIVSGQFTTVQDLRTGSPEGTDTLTGVETLSFSDGTFQASDFVPANLTLNGTSSNDSLTGGAGNDTLSGGNGNDTLNGGAGNDELLGGGGSDLMIGGIGDDLYVVGSTGDVVQEGADAGTDQIQTVVSYTLADNVETLVLLAQGGAITGTGNALGNLLQGNASANTLSGLAGNDTLEGSAGADVLNGGDGNDMARYSGTKSQYQVTIVGGAFTTVQDQRVGAPEGTDTLTSIETLSFSDGTFQVSDFGPVNQTLTGTSKNDSLTGGTGNDTLVGLAGNDTLTGGAGNDELQGGGGDDLMIGGAGDDLYVVGSAGDVVQEGADAGTDQVQSVISYTLPNHVETLVLLAQGGALSGTGNTLSNLLQGNASANTLSGLAGNDTLEGGAGADVLNGGSGNDVLYGGVDTVLDRFVIADAGGTDQIHQFVSGQDKLDFSALDANSVLGGHQAFAFANATATAFSVWHEAAGADLLIKADITGDTTADLEVLLIGVVAVNVADFKFA